MTGRRPPRSLVAAVLWGAVMTGVRAATGDAGVLGAVIAALAVFIFSRFLLRGARWIWMLNFWNYALVAVLYVVGAVIERDAGEAGIAVAFAVAAALLATPATRAYFQSPEPSPAPAVGDGLAA